MLRKGAFVGIRGLVVVVLGVVLLLTVGYWIRSVPEGPDPTPDSGAPATPTVEAADENPASSETTDRATVPQDSEPAASDSTYPELNSVFRADTPLPLLADIADFDRMRSPKAVVARQRIIDRGEGEMPAVLAALDDVVSNHGTQAQLNHLMLVAAQLGNASHADELLSIAANIEPENILSGFMYDIVDMIGAPEKSDAFAISIIADPASRDMQLFSALSRYWFSAPPEVAELALQHLNADKLLIRAGVYRVAFNGGLSARIHADLADEITNMQYAEPGNITALNVLAAIEPASEFRPRLETLRLRPGLKVAAEQMNEFVWASPEEKESLLPGMLESKVSELRSTGIAFILVNSREDLLQAFGLAGIDPDPFDIYAEVIPNFENMSREEKLLYIGEDALTKLEATAASPRTVRVSAHTRRVAGRLGYVVVAADERISIETAE
jgi:hypothetical protein